MTAPAVREVAPRNGSNPRPGAPTGQGKATTDRKALLALTAASPSVTDTGVVLAKDTATRPTYSGRWTSNCMAPPQSRHIGQTNPLGTSGRRRYAAQGSRQPMTSLPGRAQTTSSDSREHGGGMEVRLRAHAITSPRNHPELRASDRVIFGGPPLRAGSHRTVCIGAVTQEPMADSIRCRLPDHRLTRPASTGSVMPVT